MPREVTAHIRNVQFPVPTGNACDNGRPFYAMQSPVVWYEAAVGTLPGASNVQDYKVSRSLILSTACMLYNDLA